MYLLIKHSFYQLHERENVDCQLSYHYLQVELCLDYCHDNLSCVVAAPCNMGCIKDKLIARLGSKFTPLEVENLVDKKDKVKR